MEHIKHILEARRASLFAARQEKGSREWSAFTSVRDDRSDMFPVAAPRQLSIRFSRSESMHPYPRQFTARMAS